MVTLTVIALWVRPSRRWTPRRGPCARTRDLSLILLAQGAIGYVQYFTDLPEVLVGLHMFGSCLVWIAVMRVLLSLRERSVTTADVPAQADDSRLSTV
ncbi:hypothetical protein SALBM135S_08718 [Streptomyces alboniger]